jgi:hypothetical protein
MKRLGVEAHHLVALMVSGSVRPERHTFELAVLLGSGYVDGVRDERRYP